MTTTPLEKRMLPLTELRSLGSSRTLQGYAATFGRLSQDLGGFREIIRQGAFSETLKSANVTALWNHDPNFILGRNVSKTLQLAEDHVGLMATIFPPSASWAKDLMESIDRGDVSGMSFGFRVRPNGDRWLRNGKDGLPIRELLAVDLYDVSVVVTPAYPGTSVSVKRSLPPIPIRPMPSLDIRRHRLRLLELCA